MRGSLKSKREIEKMRVSGRMVAECFKLLEENVKPGVSLRVLDQLVESYILKQGAQPLYKGYQGSSADHPPFPGVICASVNHEICHGLPDDRILKEGDVIGIDIGLKYKGYCGDACVTFPVGRVSAATERMLEIGKEALKIGIEAVKPGGYLNDIGQAIHAYADSKGVAVVREWGGHGIGRNLHEPPSVSHIRQPSRGPKLRPGMVFTIEPMINQGNHGWILLPDGWTVITADGSLSVQFEHTLALTRQGVEILTTL
ncbi:MAG: type I methionyl aminopeptidase [Chloroflexi bacterium]|nr:MAG: type I methionyl aminopeptidase [Chloroflexota bacterium]PIE80967.1 MAG: type I methionyl aminopeptidase [Chloroflexota bacterium]